MIIHPAISVAWRRSGFALVVPLALVLAMPSPGEAQASVIHPTELCRDHADASIVTFEDALLEARVRESLRLDEQDDLTCDLVSDLTALNVRPAGIESLAGIQNLSGLTSLYVRGTSITDVSALSGLERLTYLNLNRNSITDISALSGLTRLTKLGLSGNSITDVSALSELTALTELRLSSNPGFSNIEPLLDHREIDSVSLLDTRVSCANVARLQSNGLFVFSACQ